VLKGFTVEDTAEGAAVKYTDVIQRMIDEKQLYSTGHQQEEAAEAEDDAAAAVDDAAMGAKVKAAKEAKEAKAAAGAKRIEDAKKATEAGRITDTAYEEQEEDGGAMDSLGDFLGEFDVSDDED
jgi:hypothetical protein